MRALRTGAAVPKESAARAPKQGHTFDTLEFELREDDYSWGVSVAAAVIGLGSSYWKVRVVGMLVQGDGAMHEIDFGHFLKMASSPLELLEGYDRKNGVEHLQKCRNALLKDGWVQTARGQHWYSWRFRREPRPNRP